MTISSRTIALLAKEFDGGFGPSHGELDGTWVLADAAGYLPNQGFGSKKKRVLHGLQALRDGRAGGLGLQALPPDEEKLDAVVQELAQVIGVDLSGDSLLARALVEDGFSTDDAGFVAKTSEDSPTTRLADHLTDLFEDDDAFEVAKNHYEQALRAFDRQDWEAANGQFRSAFEATFDALAAMNGCPIGKKAGAARKWMQEQGLIDKGEAELIQSFASFASGAGSHAGLSGNADCQLRRHFVTALMVYGIKKLSIADDVE